MYLLIEHQFWAWTNEVNTGTYATTAQIVLSPAQIYLEVKEST
jgi:hypothetical protein